MKRDEGRRLTDAELEALEKRIREMYGGAAKNLRQIIDEYFANFRLRDEEMQKLIGTVVNGREWTEEDYKQWRLAQMGRGERFEALRDKLAERLTNANEVAISYVNDATPGYIRSTATMPRMRYRTLAAISPSTMSRPSAA